MFSQPMLKPSSKIHTPRRFERCWWMQPGVTLRPNMRGTPAGFVAVDVIDRAGASLGTVCRIDISSHRTSARAMEIATNICSNPVKLGMHTHNFGIEVFWNLTPEPAGAQRVAA